MKSGRGHIQKTLKKCLDNIFTTNILEILRKRGDFDVDIAARQLFFFLLTLSKKSQKLAHFDHIRHENDFEVSIYFLTCSKFKK